MLLRTQSIIFRITVKFDQTKMRSKYFVFGQIIELQGVFYYLIVVQVC